MKKQLKDKLALVTGSSRGVGQQIAIGLAERGADVIVHGRDSNNLIQTVELLKKYDIKIYSVAGDLSTAEGVKSVISNAQNIKGGIDILYNNAAIMSYATPILEQNIKVWHKIMNVNLYAVIQLCNAFIPNMVKNKFGRVINLTSGIQDQPDLAPYSVSKAAIDKYSRDLSFELKGKNVLVNYLDPGWLKTDMGGEDAWFDVDTVIPGAIVPALLEDNGPNGQFFSAQDYKYLK